MKSFKDQGFTIKIKNYAEGDSIVTILTKYHGRVDALAKGARKIKSHKMGNLDLLALSKFSFYKGRNLDLLIEAKLENNFLSDTSLDKTVDFLNLSALLNHFLQAGESTKQIFDILFELTKNIDYQNYKIMLNSFYLKLLEYIGYEPNLYSCLNCSDKFTSHTNRYLSNDELGFLCEKHTEEQDFNISDTVLKTLRFLKETGIIKAKNLKITSNIQNSVNNIINNWLQIVTSRNLKIKKFIT